MNSKNQQLELLQICRGIAALLVVLAHLSSLVRANCNVVLAGNFFASGWAGVDFFFVLSGFIIFRRHAMDIGNSSKFTEFSWRRLIRIFPIYWIVTILMIPVFYYVPHYGLGDELHPDVIVTSILLLPSYRAPIVFAGWTLVHEMCFYCIFGLLIADRSKWSRSIVGIWCISVGWFVWFPLSAAITAHPWIRVVFSPLNFEFALGCCAAWLVGMPRAQKLPRISWGLLLGFGCGVFVMVFWVATNWSRFVEAHRVPLFGLSSFMMVLGAAGIELSAGGTRQGLMHRIKPGFVLLGDASYSLYLLHGPMLSATWKAGELVGVLSWVGLVVTAWILVLVCVIGACIFHLRVEKPMLRRLRRLPQAKEPRS